MKNDDKTEDASKNDGKNLSDNILESPVDNHRGYGTVPKPEEANANQGFFYKCFSIFTPCCFGNNNDYKSFDSEEGLEPSGPSKSST